MKSHLCAASQTKRALYIHPSKILKQTKRNGFVYVVRASRERKMHIEFHFFWCVVLHPYSLFYLFFIIFDLCAEFSHFQFSSRKSSQTIVSCNRHIIVCYSINLSMCELCTKKKREKREENLRAVSRRIVLAIL